MGSFLGLHAANNNGGIYRKSLINAASWANGVPDTHLHQSASPNVCYHGQLTDKGRSTLFQIGSTLRDLYVTQLKFLPNVFDKPEMIYLRSTDYPRTLESLDSLMTGLYPEKALKEPLFIYSRTPTNYDTPYPDHECQRYALMRKEFSKLAFKKLSHEKDAWPARIKEMWHEKHGPFLAFDVLASAVAHKWKLDLTIPEFDLLRNATTHLWFDHMDANPVIPPLLIGRFMKELSELQDHIVSGNVTQNLDFSMHSDHMVQTKAKDPPKFAVYSGHDTTIAPVLCGLGLWSGKNRIWPYFASHITIETFKEAGPVTNAHYVRVKYNDVPQNLPLCQRKGDHYPTDTTLCTYKAFKALIDQVATSRVDHNTMCQPIDQ